MALHRKHKLEKWRDQDLMDTVEKSSDKDLLVAVQGEIQHRVTHDIAIG